MSWTLVRKKLVGLLATLLAVSFLTFLLTSLLPGDPAVAILGDEGLNPENVAALRDQMHLDDPLPQRYLLWLGDVLQGDLGFSLVKRQSVVDQIATALPITLEVVVVSLVLALLMAIVAGTASAWWSPGRVDRAISSATFATLAIPSFVVAMMLILVFAVRLRWLPASGWTPLSEGVVDHARNVVLPALTLAIVSFGPLTRVLRNDMITTLQQDYILLAEAKGIPSWRVLARHALRPSSLSLVTLTGIQLGNLLGGTVIVESLFGMPGIGRSMITAIQGRDFVSVQGLTLFVAAAFVLINFAVDVLYMVLDPRIRRGRAHAGA